MPAINTAVSSRAKRGKPLTGFSLQDIATEIFKIRR